MTSTMLPLGMASLQLGSSSLDTSGFDWSNRENSFKWKGHLVEPLGRVLNSAVHPQIKADYESLEYVEGLLIKLVAMMTAPPSPTSVLDVERRVSQTFPTPIDKWALAKAQKALKRGRKKATLILPVDKIHSLLKEVLHNNRMEDQVSLYITAVIEYIAEDILKLAFNYVKKINHQSISCQDIKVAMCADTVLMDMFERDEMSLYSEEEMTTNQSYIEVVKDLIMDEKQYLRDLQMITKVFKDLIQDYNIAKPSEIESIFCNVDDILDLTVTLIGSLEDTLEMTEEGNLPAVGSCFEELAEGEEFDVYDKYMQGVLSPECRLSLENLLSRKDVSEKLISSGKGFREAVKFYLPKLLLGPIYHCLNYFRYIETLLPLSISKDDADSLTQAAAMLTQLQNNLIVAVQQAGPAAKRKTSFMYSRSGPNKISRQQSLQKLSQIQQAIVNWEGADIIASNCSEVVCEGKLSIFFESRKRLSERYVYLCDGMIIICKMKGSGGLIGGCDLKLGVKHLIRLVDVLDRKDTEDLRYTFELVPRDQPKIIFKAESIEEKNTWMAFLVMLNTKSMLERHLDNILNEEDKKHPLRFPPSDKYKFAEPNNEQNILCEDTEKSNGISLIKGATLVKLVERLTFHMYADPMFVKAFLTTYRSFSNPNELLDLLIQRFDIPDPEFPVDTEPVSESFSKRSEIQIAQDLKRFRKEYKQPVQFRVLNVLKHWVDEHFYDFDQDPELLEKLSKFLETLSSTNMKKWVDCISKIVQRRQSNEDSSRDITFDFDRSPPEFEVHIENPEPGWPELLTYHPIEIARQLTLLEFDYYRAVKPSELVDQAWMKEDKDKRSPNLLRMVRNTTMFTLCLEKLIVEAENLDERTAVIHRALEIMMVLVEYNNFNGVIAITSAMNSSSVHRLVQRIRDRIPNHVWKALDEASSLVPDHFKIYWEKLRSINPPCVPFFGQYQTNIVFLEEGNPDYLHNTNLINFSKWRKVAEIISEIQQYQNQPYCLKPLPKLKTFLENMDPFPGMAENAITDYLWEKSIEIEPRGTETIQRRRAEPKWKGLNLKSPGIKPKNLPGKIHPNPLPKIRQPHRSQQDSNGSPLTSPVFQLSPSSLPSTPFGSSAMPTPPPSKTEPIMTLVMLPDTKQTSSIPPQLPPKPPRSSHSTMSRPSTSSRHTSSPPPPLPPRKSPMVPPPRHNQNKSVFDYRSPMMGDLPLPRRQSSNSPPPLLAPRQHAGNISQGSSRLPPPTPLNLRSSSDGPNPSPMWPGPVSPDWHTRSVPHGPLTSSTPIATTGQHFTFNQNSISSAAALTSPTSPSLPPRRPVPGPGQGLEGPFYQDNYERVSEWLQSPTPELLMQ